MQLTDSVSGYQRATPFVKHYGNFSATAGKPINPSPIEWLDSGVATFDNRSPDGQLILARRIALPSFTAPELVTKIQDNNEEVTLFALLK